MFRGIKKKKKNQKNQRWSCAPDKKKVIVVIFAFQINHPNRDYLPIIIKHFHSKKN